MLFLEADRDTLQIGNNGTASDTNTFAEATADIYHVFHVGF